jgi:hypothetical protein
MLIGGFQASALPAEKWLYCGNFIESLVGPTARFAQRIGF